MIFETERLQLREMREEDFKDLCEMLCDATVMYAYEHAFSFQEAKDWLHRQMQRYQEDGVGLWAVIRKCDQVMIGQCGITKQWIHKEAVWEIGYLFKHAYWGKGYASEASRGCKKYAFETMKLTRIYSIIRDTNRASQHVAIANQMQKIGSIVKVYYQMQMPHDIYCVENASLVKRVYIDAEFDAIKIQRRYYQMVISFGAVVIDGEGTILDSFYETIRPKQYQRTSKVVLKMTGLSEAMIRSSRNLQEVVQEVAKWLQRLKGEGEMRYYSFGPDDKRTLLQHCRLESVEEGSLFSAIEDLQKPLSASVQYDGQILSSTLSLDDLKLVYDILGNVEHNALTDAYDLMQIHQAYVHQQPCNIEQIQAILKRKEEKMIASKKKQQKRLQTTLKKRFQMVKGPVHVRFFPEVLEQFRNWESLEKQFTLHFKKDYLLYEKQRYEYEQLQMVLDLQIKEEHPTITIHMTTQDTTIDILYNLNYRNSLVVERILTCLREVHE